jgi:isocitrate dehydrogenase
MTKTRITIAKGDGIGPEILGATLKVLNAAGAEIEYNEIEVGESVYKRGFSSGIEPESWDVLRETGILLKGPITTPQGGGVKSLNVTIRKTLGLFANVRPCIAYDPYIPVRHPHIDVVVVRENEEDLYAGIEHRQTSEVYQCLKLITRPGSEKIIRYAFEYAKLRGRKKITCFVKDNIMKLTDGLFHDVFKEIGAEYPEIKQESMIVDIGMARLANAPELFDVIVTTNLYGDILSDIAAEIAGSVGLSGSANIGEKFSMFEAIHGSAPDIAGQNIANPSGILLSAVTMLTHIGQGEVAAKIHNAWLSTIEDGVHTGDIYRHNASSKRVGTDEFADAVIERLGEKPERLRPVRYKAAAQPDVDITRNASTDKKLVGVDVFVDWMPQSVTAPAELAAKLQAAETDALKLIMITNRGVKVWPDGFPETFCTDHWRCRFQSEEAKKSPSDAAAVAHKDVVELLTRLADAGVDFIKTEHLCTFDGKPGFSLGQGQ